MSLKVDLDYRQLAQYVFERLEPVSADPERLSVLREMLRASASNDRHLDVLGVYLKAAVDKWMERTTEPIDKIIKEIRKRETH